MNESYDWLIAWASATCLVVSVYLMFKTPGRWPAEKNVHSYSNTEVIRYRDPTPFERVLRSVCAVTSLICLSLSLLGVSYLFYPS